MNEKSNSAILREIMDLAKSELNKNGSIGYTMPDGKHHLYIYVDDSITYASDNKTVEDGFYVIEPNRVVDGAHEPMENTTTAEYNDFAELLLGCMWCMEQFENDRTRGPVIHGDLGTVRNRLLADYFDNNVELKDIRLSVATELDIEESFTLYAELREKIDGDKVIYLKPTGEIFDIGSGERLDVAEFKEILSGYFPVDDTVKVDLGFANLVASRGGDPDFKEIFLGLENKDGFQLQLLGAIGNQYHYNENNEIIFDDNISVKLIADHSLDDFSHEVPISMNTWLCVYKDTLGYPDDHDNLTNILVPTKWFLNALDEEGIHYEEYYFDSTADDMENIARKALKEHVILDCTDKNIKHKLNLNSNLSLESSSEKSKWMEIRNNFVDEKENKVYIDAWQTYDENEEGTVIAKIDIDTNNVEYLDDDARTDCYAQAIIKETSNGIKCGLYAEMKPSLDSIVDSASQRQSSSTTKSNEYHR